MIEFLVVCLVLRAKTFRIFWDGFFDAFRSHVNQSHGRLQETVAPWIETAGWTREPNGTVCDLDVIYLWI